MATWTTNGFGSYGNDDGDNDDDIISVQSESMHSMIDTAFPPVAAGSRASWPSKPGAVPLPVPAIPPKRSSSLQMKNRTTKTSSKSAFVSTSTSTSSSSSSTGRSGGHGSRSSRPRPSSSSQHDNKNRYNDNGAADPHLPPPPNNSVKDPSCSSSSSSSRRKHHHHHHQHRHSSSSSGGHMSSSSHSTGRGSLGGSDSSHSLGGSSRSRTDNNNKNINNNKSSNTTGSSRIRRTSSSSSKGNNDKNSNKKSSSPSASSKNGRSSSSSSGRRHQSGGTFSSSFRASDKLTIGESSGLGSSTRIFPPPPPPPSNSSPANNNDSSLTSLHASERKSTSSSRLPDLFTLEQALAGCDDDTRRVERILNQSMSLQNRDFQTTMTTGGGDSSSRSYSRRSHGLSETPGVGWKTPFEVDAPREAPNRSHSPSNTTTASEEIATTTNDGGRFDGGVGDGDSRRLTEEQDAWAGIDKLLDPENLDDSFTFSTMDILPSSTVKAMRREGSFSTLDVSVTNGDDKDGEDEGDDDRTEFTASFEVLQRVKEKQEKMRKLKMKKNNLTSAMPSLVEATDQDEDNHGESFTRRLQQLQQHQDQQQAGGGGQDGQNKLFSVFHWSDKQNVDEERRRKGKLNQTRNNNKLNLQPSPFDPASTRDSDTMSLPSLATFRDDEMSVRSDLSSVYEVGSVVSSDFSRRSSLGPSRRNSLDPSRRNSLGPSSSIHSQQHELPAQQQLFSIEDNPPMEFGFETGTDPLAVTNKQPAPLVFDKQVDDYIRKIQEHLPTIAEYDGPGSPSKSKRGPSVGSWLESKVSPAASAAIQEDSSVIDDLPSLASLGTTPAPGNDDSDKKGGRRKEKKKDPTHGLLGSIKKFSKGGNPKPKAKGSNVAAGDEEKYFPDADKEKEVKANKGLLNSDDEGGWD